MEFFKQQSSIDPLTLGLLGASAGFLDPQGGMSAGFQGAMQGMMAGQDMKYRNAMAQMQQNKFLRSEMARGLLQETLRQHTRPDGTVDHKAAINALTASGMPELMGHVKTLQSALPQYKARYEVMGEGGAPKMMAINQFGETNELPGTPWKAPIRMDLGGSAALIDPSTNQPRAQFRKSMSPDASANLGQRQYEFGIENARNNARFNLDYNPDFISMREGTKASARENAQLQAKALNALPATINTVNQVMETTNKLADHPALDQMVGGLPTRMFGEAKAFYGDNKEADFKALYNQIGSQQFLAAIEYMRGLGALTEREGEKAQNSVTNLSTAQSVDDFKNSIKVFQDVMMSGLNKIQSQAGIKANPVLNDYEKQPSRNDRNSYISPDGIKSTIKNTR